MHLAELTAPEQRVLGCLIEKRFTTPDAYPLSLNALRLASNQSTNRDPITDYDEATLSDAAQRLSRYGLARLASGAGSRAVKYRHLAEDALQVNAEELAVLAVLLLRGSQTPGELKARTDRMVRFDSLAELDHALERLVDRGYVERIARRPGQKEDRFAQLLGGRGGASGSVSNDHPAVSDDYAVGENRGVDDQPAEDRIAERVSALETELAALRAELSAIRAALGRESQADHVRGATDDQAGEGHLEPGGPPGPQRHE